MPSRTETLVDGEADVRAAASTSQATRLARVDGHDAEREAEPDADRALWRLSVGLILAFTAARLAYMIWFSPWELVGDEAYYWVQSQHPALSYAEKGPLLPWLIHASCRVFGNTEWAVRLPVLLGSAISAWGVGRLTLSVTRGNQRAAFLSVVIFILTPAFIANAQICTQDGLLIPLIVALTAVGLRLVRRWEAGNSTWIEWLSFYALLGVGLLLKQSVLLFASALVVYAVLRRRRLRWSATLVAQQVAGTAIVLAMLTPVIIWERHNGWPMLRHTLGHLGAGGDQEGRVQRGNVGLWLANCVGGLIGAVGPVLALMVLASAQVWKQRREEVEATAWRDRLWLMCAGWPSALFFVALAFTKPVVPSWPLPCVVPLVPLAAEFVAGKHRRFTGRSRERRSGFDRLWDFCVLYGLGALVLLSYPTLLGRLPFIGGKLERGVVTRLTAGRVAASRVRAAITAIANAGSGGGGESRSVSRVVTSHYQSASLLSFYLPREFHVTCGGSYVANRLSNYDTWDDTRLDSRDRLGESMLLVGASPERWRNALGFERVEVTSAAGDDQLFVGVDFRGPLVNRVDRRGVTKGKP